ncbi:putative aspartyl protease [Sphingomonas vulcanisoli]|uniref:Aspartyl protease n=1 Tax=Sphingomonas vulcanisoli TaxID=1658060 RepID=A0ABX0TLR3_9SPHN|nr:aspartyl protease family protein [Sphingomonas vulcanisoli]NIJ06452.1 putative aspartyl protease [Sphingomonas vulcanisoli]
MHILLLAILAAGASSVGLPITQPADVPPTETLAAASDFAARMTLPAQVNGHGPYRFMIDTGADRSVVSDRLAQELSLAAGSPVTVYGIQGPEPVTTAALETLRIGRREHHAITAPVLPQGSLGASGMIGLDALANESVLFDFKRNEVTIARSATEAMVGNSDVITVVGKSRFGQLILTDARVKGVKVYAIIDTGAESTIGNLALRKLMGRSGPLDDKGARIIGATGASLPAESGSVPTIRLGSLQIADMPIAYCDVATFRKFGIGDKPAILIGMDVLRGFERVAVDFRRRQVRFRVGEGVLAQTS